MEHSQFENHPYYLDGGVIEMAFKMLEQEQNKCWKTLANYKRALSKEAHEQLHWENERIAEVKKKVFGKYFN